MIQIPEGVREFAESPEGYASDPEPPEERIFIDGCCLYFAGSGTQANITRIKTTESELDRVIDEVRKIVRPRGVKRVLWSAGPSSRPQGLAALLTARGFFPGKPPWEPEAEVMVLVSPPPPPPVGVEARLVRDLDEYRTALRIAIESFEMPADEAEGWLSAAPKLWKSQDGVNRMTLIALVEGRPAGFAFAAASAGPYGLLCGGSGVLPAERGRGCYRALVAARWARAVELGKPALAIHAGAMSRPIAERGGFVSLGRIENFEDPELG
jgi:GNAT superfamily N-acetyltransferase